MKLLSRLYVGKVYHRRNRPKHHQLRYSVFTLLLDLSETKTLAKKFWLFSLNKFNLLAFYEKDFGEPGVDETLEDYVCRQLRDAGLCSEPAQILLSCFPRILGYSFNPLSLFYCFDADGKCFAVLHEVHNTFGERHVYVLPVAASNSSEDWIYQSAEKELFVSPFAHMDMHYQFRLNQPDERQVIVIRACDSKGVVITASYAAQQKPLTAAQLLRLLLVFPFQSAKVVLGIHWEALRLFLKGVPWFKHEPKGSN